MEKFSVYMHVNKINGKRYIGITCQGVDRRWRSNGEGYKSSDYFYNAISKYGWDNFEHLVLSDGLSKEEAEKEEIRLIKHFNSTNPDKGYNISNGGTVAGKHSEATRKKISERNKERPINYDVIRKMQEVNRNREYSLSHKKNISKALKGRKLSESHIEALKYSHIGYKHTEEQKKKISESNKKTKGTTEHRKLISQKMKELYQNNPDLMKNASERNRKKVICLTTGEIFEQLRDGAKKYGLKSATGITEVCKGRRPHAGKLQDGTPLKWKYYD